jgi:aspartokinase/homoserine dehydrogenase 1
MKEFVRRMKALNLAGSVFIDCTAADEIVGYYEDILSSSISVVTPNKRANSGKYEDYTKSSNLLLFSTMSNTFTKRMSVQGLPVINTLNDLLSSGDKILKIEAVLSGLRQLHLQQFQRRKKV